jgi:hypothetical protein
MTGTLVKYETIPTNATTYEEQVAIVELMRRLACTPGVADRLMRCLERFPEMERCLTGFEDRCRTTQQRCDSIEMLCQNFLCPGNVNFSQRTIDEYSNRSLVKLKEIVQNLGGDFVNAFPVPPGKKIRLTHKPRPGYTPTKMRVDMNLAGGAQNYSDFTLQFFLIPGGVNSDQGLEIGNENDGNLYLNKDGSQIEVTFPEYRGTPLDIGSLETLAVVISNNGGANNLDSAHVNVWYDNSRFYELCKARCACK